MTSKKGVSRFEDLIAWQKARAMAQIVYRLTMNGPFLRDHALRDQLRRSAVSVMSNIAEGFERASQSEFHQFLSVAKASCAELRSQLYVALDARYLDPTTFGQLFAQSEELARIIGALRAAVQLRRDEARKRRQGASRSPSLSQHSAPSTQH